MKKLLIINAILWVLGFMVCPVFATVVTTFTPRLTGNQNVIVSVSPYLEEGEAGISNYMFVKEGTSDRAAMEIYLGDKTIVDSMFLIFDFIAQNLGFRVKVKF